MLPGRGGMVDAMGLITMLASTAAEGGAHESSHNYTLFYVLGGVLAGFAVLISVIGMSKADFPGSGPASKAVMAVGAVLSAAAMFAAVYVTS